MEDLTNSPGTATPKTPAAGTPPANQPGNETPPPKSKAERLEALLSDEPADKDQGIQPPAGAGTDDGDGKGGSRAPKAQPKPKQFNDLAERLGVELSDLYKLEVATATDGSPVTVEQLKDAWAKRSDFSVSQLKWEEERGAQQAELVRANAELRELLSALPKDAVKPEVLDKVRRKHEETIRREQAATLRAIPEWADKETHTAELAEMAEWLQQYGFPVEYLKSVYDHRALFMMRSAWRREQRVKAALAEVEKDDNRTPRRSGPGGKPPEKGATRSEKRGRAGLLALLED